MVWPLAARTCSPGANWLAGSYWLSVTDQKGWSSVVVMVSPSMTRSVTGLMSLGKKTDGTAGSGLREGADDYPRPTPVASQAGRLLSQTRRITLK